MVRRLQCLFQEGALPFNSTDNPTLTAKALGNHSLRIAKSCMIFHDRFREKKLCFLVHHVLITALRPSERGTGRHMTQRIEPPWGISRLEQVTVKIHTERIRTDWVILFRKKWNCAAQEVVEQPSEYRRIMESLFLPKVNRSPSGTSCTWHCNFSATGERLFREQIVGCDWVLSRVRAAVSKIDNTLFWMDDDDSTKKLLDLPVPKI